MHTHHFFLPGGGAGAGAGGGSVGICEGSGGSLGGRSTSSGGKYTWSGGRISEYPISAASLRRRSVKGAMSLKPSSPSSCTRSRNYAIFRAHFAIERKGAMSSSSCTRSRHSADFSAHSASEREGRHVVEAQLAVILHGGREDYALHHIISAYSAIGRHG
jgi:hypothetical protein